MSDSESDDDFLSARVNKVHSVFSRKKEAPTLGTVLKEVPQETARKDEPKPKKARRGNASEAREENSQKENQTTSLESSLLNESDVSTISIDQFDITPPGSPNTKTPKSIRGANRTKKTIQALAKIKKNKHIFEKKAHVDESPAVHYDDVLVVDDNDTRVNLKIKWKSEIIRLEASEEERLGSVMDRFGEEVGVEGANLLLFTEERVESTTEDGTISVHHKEGRLTRDMTVRAAGLDIASIVNARLRHVEESKDDSDLIELKIQTKDRRGTAFLKVARDDPMSVVMQRFCELKEKELDDCDFYFDGEPLEPDETCESLELEGGECIDVHFKNQ